jgi:predicted cupin superfamily sugar epimerase
MTELPDWALRLDLSPHPEGGWFRETWRSELTVAQSALPPDYTGPRSAGTAILFLLMPGQQSAWHTVRSAELWMYHRGSPLLLEVGREQDEAATLLLGGDVMAGEQPQLLVPPGHWQRARPSGDEPTLVSCVVVPGFDFADFALAAVSPATTPR